ncbi:S-protein homolog 74 [Linum grandiflorum]
MMKLVAFSFVLTLAIAIHIAPASGAPAAAPAYDAPAGAPTSDAPAGDADKGSVVPSTSKPVVSKDYTEVHVVNELKDDKKAMRVHCKSKDEDLGVHDVPAGSEYQWRIKNTDAKATPYTCGVSANDKEIVFKAYFEDAELLRRVNENNSYWVVKDDGIYLRQVWKKTDVFWQPWP